MNKFKKPYSNRAGIHRPRFGTSTYPRSGAAARGGRSEVFQKFDAVCSNCGKKCQVPFRPDGTKPVYCKDCFGVPREALKGKKGFSINPQSLTARTSQPQGEGKSIADLTRQIAAMNTKIDAMLKILKDGEVQE